MHQVDIIGYFIYAHIYIYTHIHIYIYTYVDMYIYIYIIRIMYKQQCDIKGLLPENVD